MPSREKVSAFRAGRQSDITEDDKGQAQVFLVPLSQSVGQTDSLEVGDAAALRIREIKKDSGGTALAESSGNRACFQACRGTIPTPRNW